VGFLQDSTVNIFGRRPQDGYANRPFSNVGVQYALKALLARKITPAQFLDVNQKMGGRDINFVRTTARTTADPGAINAVYRSGAVNDASNLDLVAIIDQPAQNTDIHEQYRALIVRERLDKAHGNHDNDVIHDARLGSHGHSGRYARLPGDVRRHPARLGDPPRRGSAR
jgi:hypothetical protein